MCPLHVPPIRPQALRPRSTQELAVPHFTMSHRRESATLAPFSFIPSLTSRVPQCLGVVHILNAFITLFHTVSSFILIIIHTYHHAYYSRLSFIPHIIQYSTHSQSRFSFTSLSYCHNWHFSFSASLLCLDKALSHFPTLTHVSPHLRFGAKALHARKAFSLLPKYLIYNIHPILSLCFLLIITS